MSTRWHKVQHPSYSKVDSILTKFVEKMKPLREQLVQETEKLRQAIEDEKQKGTEGL